MKTLVLVLVWLLTVACGALAQSATPGTTIVCPADASPRVKLAAKEVRRYVYLRTGELLPIAESAAGNTIALKTDAALENQQYGLKSDGKSLVISGGSDVAVLYGAYAFAEKLGVRFYLHGDTVPDATVAWVMPTLDETHKPLFATRGIQPFHDFPEGPDWWNRDDYLAYVSQLAKMKMNFIGMHCYPENDNLGPEIGVWLGLPDDLDGDGNVRFSYSAWWANTAKGVFTIYSPMKTSEFSGGASQLFPADDYGPDVMKGLMPRPASVEQGNELFNRVVRHFQQVIAHARQLGVKTCIGTATPLCVPKALREHLQKLGKNPDDPETIKALYRGTFQRIAKLYPVDYYWLWTSETWTWSGNNPAQLRAIERDIQIALDVLQELGNPFTLATCGWVLGPQGDRTALDKLLPKQCPMACISRNVGHDGVEPAFANLKDRPKWAIPWVENDPNMVGYQPWVSRMRYDAVDARRFGCTGLMGIHWRTKILAQNLSALAGAAWDQSYVPAGFKTDLSGKSANAAPPSRFMPCADFYADFAKANFGDEVAEEAGRLWTALDGEMKVSDWGPGPGALKTGGAFAAVAKDKGPRVEQFAALRGKIVGAGNLARFDYWVNTLRASIAMSEGAEVRNALVNAVKVAKAEKDPVKKAELAKAALKCRIDLARAWDKIIALAIAAADTPGELGTIANLEEHSRKNARWIDEFDSQLTQLLGHPLPETCAPASAYADPAKLTVLTVRGSVAKGEALTLPILALDKTPVKSVSVRVRPLGRGQWQTIAAKHTARAVWHATLPVAADDFEYQVLAETGGTTVVSWPATAPRINQTVVVTAD